MPFEIAGLSSIVSCFNFFQTKAEIRQYGGKFILQAEITLSDFEFVFAGLCSGHESRLEKMPCIIIFDPSGRVGILDGDTFTTLSEIRYEPGKTFRIRMVVNQEKRRYSVFIAEPEWWREEIIGHDCRFNSLCENTDRFEGVCVLSSRGDISTAGLTVKPFSVYNPVLFGSPEADTIMRRLRVFPKNSHWNYDISEIPVLSDSYRIIERIGKDKNIDYNLDMNFVIAPSDQALVNVEGMLYPNECDPGPFPIPDNAPLENWPMQKNEDVIALPHPGETLEEFQKKGSGDRHVLVIDADSGMLHEFWQSYKTDKGWKAATAVSFNMNTNNQRPEGWTSADASGMPVFPAVVRYDEVEDGIVGHAMRFTVSKTRKEYIYPARHFASSYEDKDLPRMGERFRLRQDFDITDYPLHVQAILKGLKKYGMYVADNGKDWMISISPDPRIKGLETIKRLKGSDFEVVDTSKIPVPDI